MRAVVVLLSRYSLNLEQIVKQRTAELGDANREIMALNKQLKAENLRMETELDVARQLQQMLLPREEELQKIEGLDIAGFMKPADEIGGDYYDVLQHNGHVKIGIGDVTGHGLESGIVMLMTQMGVRTLLTSNETFQSSFFYCFESHNLWPLQEFAPKFIILMVGADTHNHLRVVVRYNFSN